MIVSSDSSGLTILNNDGPIITPASKWPTKAGCLNLLNTSPRANAVTSIMIIFTNNVVSDMFYFTKLTNAFTLNIYCLKTE